MDLKTSILFAFLPACVVAFGQADVDSSSSIRIGDRIELSVYGSILYNNYNWETDSSKRDNVDLNHVVISPEFEITDKISLELEIEFEHGGSGATMEFDRFEEFGEFEQEIEHGGEVIIEEIEIEWEIKPWFELKAGKIKVPVGLANFYYHPVDYLTTTYNNVEETMMPVGWYEIGIGAEGKISNKWEYNLVFVNALDNSAFNSANFIKRGNHQRFEYTNAESFALAGRLDFLLNENSSAGITAYAGNSTPNRPKPDLDANGWVNIFDAHFHLEQNRTFIQALAIYGTVQNAYLINEANRNLSNNLNVKRTPVGSAALGAFVEAGYDIMPWLCNDTNSSLFIFAGYYYYDTMYDTSGENFNNPRWEKTELRGGINYTWNDMLGVKADFTNRQIGIPDNNLENTLTTSVFFNL